MNRGGGYTIVETMIFLAVTGVLLISAMSLMSGRQASVQFSQAVTDAQSRMQDIIGQVATGYVPPANYKCKVDNPGNAASKPSFDIATTSQQGSSDACVFLGKAVVFNDGDDGGQASIMSIAARRLNSSGREVSSLAEARPVPISKLSSVDTQPDTTENFTFDFGVHITRIVALDKDGIAIEKYGTILFLSTLPKYQSLTSTLASGAQRVSFAGIKNSLTTDDQYQAATKLVAFDESGVTINPAGGIVICLADAPLADAKRKAMLKIGEGAAQTSVTLDVGGYDSRICEQ